MATPKMTEREVRIARAFLKGTGGNQQSGYLLRAVITWLRAMTKAGDSYWKSLGKYSAASAGSRLATRLKAKAGAGTNEYDMMLKIARQRPTGNEAQWKQGDSFLYSVMKSNWDPKHYGYKEYVAPKWVVVKIWHQTSASGGGYWEYKTVWQGQDEVNPMRKVWEALLKQSSLPDKWFIDKEATTTTTPGTPAKNKTVPPSGLGPPSAGASNYIDPEKARQFYDASRPKSDLGNLPAT